MSKFVFIYDNGGEEAKLPMEKVMEAWMSWFGSLGSKLIDGGNPFNTGAKAVSKSGVSEVKSPSSGYSLVEAKDSAEAVEMAKGCPMLEHVSNGSVQVYEALPM